MFIPAWMLITVVIINIGVVSFFIVDWFRKNYTVVDLETWNTIANFYNENNKEVDELPGGTGFFRECLYDDIDEEEEEEDE